jgi:hypothetical protein
MPYEQFEHHAFYCCHWVALLCAGIGCLALGLSDAKADATVSNLTVSNGQSRFIEDFGQIQTVQNDTATTVAVQSGGSLILWSGNKVVLKPGFHASTGAFFWGTVDSDMNGYSDAEELQQNFIPGVPDAWLADHGVNLSAPMSSWAYAPSVYLAAYMGGYMPGSAPGGGGGGSYPVVLVTASGNFGVQPSAGWALNPL